MRKKLMLDVQELVVEYPLKKGNVRAVDHVSLQLYTGDALGLVGESGCGKSTLGFSLIGLLKGGVIRDGKVIFKEKDLTKMDEKELRLLRGNEISMIFQASQNVLNPLLSVTKHFEDTLIAHNLDKKKIDGKGVSVFFRSLLPKKNPFQSFFNRFKKKMETISPTEAISDEAWNKVLELIRRMEIAENRLNDLPYQFSGGMQQRIVIALSLILQPRLLIADEPTTALDVLVQARILDLLRELKEELDLTMIFISHDLGVVAELTNRMAIMYAGQIVELGGTRSIFKSPKHPYTEALIEAIPEVKDKSKKQQKSIPGIPPDLRKAIMGCRFAERCKYTKEICKIKKPGLIILDTTSADGNDNQVRCFKYDKQHSKQFK